MNFNTPTIQRFNALLILLAFSFAACGQSPKSGRDLSEMIMVDSSSTLMIPVTYNTSLFTSDKAMTWGNNYANIIFYNFNTDTYTRLFEKDTYIRGFKGNQYYQRDERNNDYTVITKEWIFYFVKGYDYDGNEKVDENDPSTLFVTNKKGEGLKSLTGKNENVVSIDFFNKQGFALIKIQRDVDGDKDFTSHDRDFYLMRIDLKTLQPGNKIEIR